ncbi:hypothetical protein T233_00619 [Vagococcus lutrae LBD1]|uniref:O-antigen polysaccharide polymerase Wzy n=1 Tax=Vagococcus lutrae LBD1 TaxID=1408226 RepID=V6Q504_9ENTE|nr:hypothetical protein T233_00619 [Vagococcus lutrae LBD1]
MISIIIANLNNILYSFKNIKKHILFCTFNISFFIFLIGRLVVSTIFKYKKQERGLYGLNFAEEGLVMDTLLVLFVSLVGLYLGYLVINRISDKVFNDYSEQSYIRKKIDLKKMRTLEISSKILFYLSIGFRLFVVYEMRTVSVMEGYYESFSWFSSSLPKILVIFSEMYDMFFFSYLATNPQKKKLYLPMGLYILEGVIAASAGRRSVLMLNILLVMIYFVLRNSKEDKWFGKKETLLGVVLVPNLMIIMTSIGQMRANFSERVKTSTGLVNNIFEFFYSQGVSVNLIGYTEIFKENLPKKCYTLGPVIEFFQNSIVNRLKGLPKVSLGQTVERATEGFLYSQAISYLIMPQAYLNGFGYGSSFVAENYADFGILGVFIGSFFYSVIIYAINKLLLSDKYILKIFALGMARIILFSPRAAYLSFLVAVFSPKKILAVIFVVVFGKLINQLKLASV